MTTVSPSPSLPDRPDGFDQEIHALVAATAPRLFAVIEEFATEGYERDARVAAWGLAFDDGSAQVTSVDGGFRMSLRTPARAVRLVSLRPGSVGGLVWPESSGGVRSVGD